MAKSSRKERKLQTAIVVTKVAQQKKEEEKKRRPGVPGRNKNF